MKNLFDISNKVCIVTGGSGVLGGAISSYLLQQKVKIAILGSNKDRLDAKIKILQNISNDVIGFECDVLDKTKVEEVCSHILNKFGTIDVLLNAAGGNMPGATIADDENIFDIKLDDFKKVSDLNLNGTLIPSLVFGKVMADKGSGVIVNYSSMAAFKTITRVVGYSASKAAVTNLTKWMATEFALKFGDKLRVNAIAPGFFIGNQNRTLLLNNNGSYTDRGNKIIANTPMKRFGKAEELNGAIHWLISDASSFVTGAIVPVDGGFNIFSGV
ncbi:MAG: D-mannonate oxidoreductase [Bacteroidetes bacterium 4572_77]|nr:MAG: D-mannonate oxidoreductase [Bacteroidetes bacterium 4572_77]